MSVATHYRDCLNCRAALAGPYCAVCGQKAIAPNPTTHELLHESVHEFLHVDGRLWRSIWLLLMRPGLLTREYCDGRRASHVTPLRLYLIFSVLSFAAAALTPADVKVRQDPDGNEVVETRSVNISGERLLGRHTAAEVGERIRHVFHDWLPRLLLVMLPVWALLVMMFTRSAPRNFPTHMAFSLHANAAFSAAWTAHHLLRLAGSSVLNTATITTAAAYILWYKTVGMRSLFGGSWILNGFRALAISAIYIFIVVIAISMLLSFALLR